MKVSLIAPNIEGAYKQPPKPPLGLAYIASSLEAQGHEVNIIDMYSTSMSSDDLVTKVKNFGPDLVGFSVLTPYIKTTDKLASRIKIEYMDVPIVVGGPHPSSIPKRTLEENSSVDMAVFGEGEETMSELVDKLTSGDDVSAVKGIVYRDGDNIIVNPERPLISDIDKILFPAWHLLDMELYLTSLSSKRTFQIITTRGCPGRCTFCDSHRIWRRRLRMRSPQNIIKELKILKSKYNMEYFVIQDDTFVVNKKRVKTICESLIKENMDLTWECKGRVNLVDKEVLAKMKEAGCTYISYGGESGSQEVLDYIKKGITIEQVRKAVQITKDVGMGVGIFWMMGFPPETEEHIRATLKLAKELNTDFTSSMNILIPFPGTDIYQNLKEDGLVLDEDWEKYFKVPDPGTYVEPFIRTKYLSSKELLRIKKEVDSDLNQFIYKKILKKQLLRPHRLFFNFIKNPIAFTKRATIFTKTLMTNFAKQ